MTFVSATFTNNYSASRFWTISDTGIDPNHPKVIFNDYLDVNDSTPVLQLRKDYGGTQGHAQYQRSDGQVTAVDVTDGSVVGMS